MIFWQFQNLGIRPSTEVLEKADHDADRAIELDPSCSVGYRAKASVAFTKGQLEISVMNYQKGANLESGGESLSWLGYLHALAGQIDQARDFCRQAARVDPLNDFVYDLSGIVEIYAGNFNAAVSSLKRASEINPSFTMHYLFLSIALDYAGKKEESIIYLKLFGKDPGFPNSMLNMWLAATSRDEKGFLKYHDLVKEYAACDKEVSWWIADCSSMIGNIDMCLYWIENTINVGLFNHVFFSEINPNLNSVRKDPRFNALMEKAKNREDNFKKVLGY